MSLIQIEPPRTWWFKTEEEGWTKNSRRKPEQASHPLTSEIPLRE